MNMTPKATRMVRSDIATLLRPKELITALQAMKQLEFVEQLCREIKTPAGRSVYLSEGAYKSFLRLIDTIKPYLQSNHIVEYEDVYKACKAVLGPLYLQDAPSLDAGIFLSSVDEILNSMVKKHKFYTTLDGLNLDDIDEVRVGRLTVQKPDLAIFQQCVANEARVQSIWRRMDRGLWISAELTGSFKYAEQLFFREVKTACGLLALAFTTVLERGGAAVRLIPSMEGRVRPRAASWFSFSLDTKILNDSWSVRGYQALSLNKKQAEDLLGCEWFKELIRITQQGENSDVENAVRRGIYWFFDAQTDTTPEMQLVKFWSCIECIFSFEKAGKTTESIKRGLTVLLTFGNYRFFPLDHWELLMKEIGELYDLRSQAVHDANHNHVRPHHVTKVSQWAAWVMLEVAGLISDGYRSRAEIKLQTDRLFGLLQKRRPIEKA